MAWTTEVQGGLDHGGGSIGLCLRPWLLQSYDYSEISGFI